MGEEGTKHRPLLHSLRDREAHRHRCEHRQTEIQKQTQAPALIKPEPRGMCIWEAKRGDMEDEVR